MEEEAKETSSGENEVAPTPSLVEEPPVQEETEESKEQNGDPEPSKESNDGEEEVVEDNESSCEEETEEPAKDDTAEIHKTLKLFSKELITPTNAPIFSPSLGLENDSHLHGLGMLLSYCE